MKFISLIIFLSALCFAQNKDELKTKLDNLLNDDFFQSASIAVDIYDLTEKEILYQKDKKKLLHPASNMKVLTSAAGLLFLGSEFKFQTSIYYTGEIINGTLYGNLYVKGKGDPDFNSDDLYNLIDSLQSLGIKEITGSIIGDVSYMDSLFWGRGWMWDDDPSTDAPYLSPLTINDNAVGVIVSGTAPGAKADVMVNPNTRYVKIINEAITGDENAEDEIYITRDWLNRKNTIIIKGKVSNEITAGFTRDYDYINIYNPKEYFLTLLTEGLQRKGIKLSGKTGFSEMPSNAVPAGVIERRYDSVIVNLNKQSDNLSAEMTLFALGSLHKEKRINPDDGIKIIDSLISLTGLNPDNYRLVDGSGVSHYNLVTAELILEVLKYFYYEKPELYKILYESFPIAGVDGTLKRRMIGTKAENNVHAKTGTLSGVSCLSGYVTAENGNMVAFSILIQNHVRSTQTAVKFQNEICKLLAEYGRQ